jgi:hypothetical protein
MERRLLDSENYFSESANSEEVRLDLQQDIVGRRGYYMQKMPLEAMTTDKCQWSYFGVNMHVIRDIYF